MSNTSATGGFLLPSEHLPPLEGQALLDFLQEWLVGITGLDASLVRPRWQPEPPNLPDDFVTWVAFGITKRVAETFSAEVHSPTEDGYNSTVRHEELFLLASFYGPDADEYCSRVREGAQVAQNREVLLLNNMAFVSCEDMTAMPELVKEKWLYRVDLPFSIRRKIVRNYSVRNLVSAEVVINDETRTVDVVISN